MSKADIQRQMQKHLKEATEDEWFGSDDNRFDFFLSVLLRHPSAAEKIGPGVTHFAVRCNGEYRTKGPWCRRYDGVETDWSYRQCLYPSTPSANLSRGMRTAVQSQIDVFSSIHAKVRGEHVAHVGTCHFDELMKDFLTLEHIDPDTVEYVPHVDGDVNSVTIVETPWLQRWREYHQTHANLEIQPAGQNLRTKRPVQTNFRAASQALAACLEIIAANLRGR